MATIAADLKLEPAEAVAYFRQKGAAITWDWHDMERGAHSQAFTVAKATSADVLQAIQEQVNKAVSSGMTFDQFKRVLRPQLEAAGWWGKAQVLDGDTGEITQVQLGSNRRLRTIYQTNVQTAYMAGRYQRYLANVENRPYWRYVAILDGRTRPAHRALHGKVFRWDDPIWQVIWPPNGWGCRCRVQALTEAEFRRLGVPLEDGSNVISTVDVAVNKEGKTLPVQVVRYRDEAGRDRIFRPDPGWDYNPGAEYANTQTIEKALAGKLQRLPANIGSRIAADVVADVDAVRQLDDAWRGWVDAVMDDPVARKRTALLGYMQPEIVGMLEARSLAVDGVSIMVDDSMLVGQMVGPIAARGNTLATADWLGLSAGIRTPQAVLLDRANGTVLYVLASPDGKGQQIVIARAHMVRSQSPMASSSAAYRLDLSVLQQELQGGNLELLEGNLDG